MSMVGRSRSSQHGSHHARCPSRLITAGTRVIRTRNASMSTPTASAKPNCLMVGSSLKTKLANPETMMIAAAATTWLPCWLDRLLPTIDIEGEAEGEAEGEVQDEGQAPHAQA